jgi:hypothetical protein
MKDLMDKAKVMFMDNIENRLVDFKPTGKKVMVNEDRKAYELVEIISIHPPVAPPRPSQPPRRPLPPTPAEKG